MKHLACFLAHSRCVAWQLPLLWSSSSTCLPGWLGALALVSVENLLREAGPDPGRSGGVGRSGFHSEYIGYLGFLEIRSDIVLF